MHVCALLHLLCERRTNDDLIKCICRWRMATIFTTSRASFFAKSLLMASSSYSGVLALLRCLPRTSRSRFARPSVSKAVSLNSLFPLIEKNKRYSNITPSIVHFGVCSRRSEAAYALATAKYCCCCSCFPPPSQHIIWAGGPLLKKT